MNQQLNNEFGRAMCFRPPGSRGGSRTPPDPNPAPPAGRPVVDPHGALQRQVLRCDTAAVNLLLKSVMKNDLARMGGGTISRTLAAEDLSEALDRPVSETALNGLVAPSHSDRRLPAADIPGWCRAMGSLDVLELIAERCGVSVTDPRIAQVGALVVEIKLMEERLDGLLYQVLDEIGGR